MVEDQGARIKVRPSSPASVGGVDGELEGGLLRRTTARRASNGTAGALDAEEEGHAGEAIRTGEEASEGPADLAELAQLHEASVLQGLQVRFARGQIYTLTGRVLLAVNPCGGIKALPHLYGGSVLEGHLRIAREETARGSVEPHHRGQPHIFTLAAKALHGVDFDARPQTVIITGESAVAHSRAAKCCKL